MPITYDDLKATRSHFQDITILEKLLRTRYGSSDDIIDMEYEKARRLMLSDIQAARGYDPASTSDVTRLNDLCSTWTNFFQQALAYKQMELVFHEIDHGDGSLNRDRWLDYQEMYRKAQRQFSALTLTRSAPGASAVTVGVKL